MEFQVIYTIDCAQDSSIARYKPRRRVLDRLQLTERNENDGEMDYVDMPKHRKWWGVLTKEQFIKFIDDTGLVAEDIETMGALGFNGIQPAISFGSENAWTDGYHINAYVTPFIPDMKKPGTEKQWERLRRKIIEVFGY